MPETPLTNKQRAFCREYVKDSNGTQAAIRAGYSIKGADVRAANLLVINRVKAEISQLLAKLSEKMETSVESVQKMYESAHDLAIRLNQPAAAITAITGIARLYALDKDSGVTDSPDPLSEQELAWLRELAGRMPHLSKEA